MLSVCERERDGVHFNWGDFEEWDWVARRAFKGKRNHYKGKRSDYVLDLSPLSYRTDAQPGCHYYDGDTIHLTDNEESQNQDRNRDCLRHCILGHTGLLP